MGVDAMKLVRVAAVAAVVLLVLAAGVVAVAAAFGERLLAAAIERAGPALVGRDVRVGEVSIDWGFPTSVAATDLVVADAELSADAPLLRAGRAEVTVDLLDLLRLRLSPVRLALRQPALRLARDERGRWNLPPAGSGGGGASGGGSFFELGAPREVEVESGEVTVDYLPSPGIEARIAAFSARGTPNGLEFRGTASQGGGDPVPFSGEAGPVAALFGDGEGGAKPYPVRLTVGPETARLSAVGHLARPLGLSGVDLRVEARGDDLAPLLAAFAAAPATATPPFQLAARLTDTERGWSLRDVEARLGESRMTGKAAVSFAGGQGRPRLSFDLVAPRLVSSDLGWLSSVGGGRDAPSGSLLDARLPTAWLRRADAAGDLRVERLEGLAAEPAALRLGFELEGGRLRVQPLRLELAGSAAEGTATVDAAGGPPPRIALRAEASDLQLGPLLAAFGVGKVAGTLRTASVDLRGPGTTPREVAAGLDGAARFRMVDGSIGLSGLSHVSMGLVETLGVVLGGGGGAGATPVTCAVGEVPVRGGVAHAERLAVLIPGVVITGEGTVRLGEGAVRLTLMPHPLDEALFRVVVPVVISGELASPEVTKHPDLRVGTRPEAASDACGKEAGHR